MNFPANCKRHLLSWPCTKWVQGSTLCNRRFVCLNAGNSPLKKIQIYFCHWIFKCLLLSVKSLCSTPFRFYTITISSRPWSIFPRESNPLNWNIATKFFQQPFPNSPNAHLYVLRYDDTPDHKILHNLVKHSFVLYFCENSKTYPCRNLLHRILYCM